MTDQELLELAAKAAGIEVDKRGREVCIFNEFDDDWNPLEDDGDALRLAVKLDLPIETTHYQVAVGNEWERHNQIDKMELLRRLIVRAAAEAGKTVPQKPAPIGPNKA